jgi:hypothetical protein
VRVWAGGAWEHPAFHQDRQNCGPSQDAPLAGSANDLLKKIRTLIKFANDSGWRTDDPTLRIKTFPEQEFHTWTEDEIAQYEKRWPIGSRERTGFALHVYTGQRRSDVAHMAWPDLAGNAINVVQAKTGARLNIPLHPNLSAALRAWPRKHVVMLTTAFNKPFSDAGYGNMMADAIAAAGLPDRCVLHGLRKAAARRLAEAGCTEKEIAAVTGHTIALNVPGSRFANRRGRNADFFLFSKRFVGSELTGYVDTRLAEAGMDGLNAGTAMAISGAAAAPNMGMVSMWPLSPTIALLNVRLGRWMRHPYDIVKYAKTSKLAQWWRGRPGPKRLLSEAFFKSGTDVTELDPGSDRRLRAPRPRRRRTPLV